MPDKLVFTITPKTGYYHSNNEMAFLDGGILAYHPTDVGDVDGDVYFLYYEDGDITRFHLRLWSVSETANQKMRAEIHIETTVPGETSTFFFGTPKSGGGINPLGKPIPIVGAKKEVLKVEYSTDINKGGLIGMYATKKAHDVSPFILRKIQVFQL